jgi:hypothetical protein
MEVRFGVVPSDDGAPDRMGNLKKRMDGRGT